MNNAINNENLNYRTTGFEYKNADTKNERTSVRSVFADDDADIYEEFNRWQKESYELSQSNKEDEIDGFDFLKSGVSPEDEEFAQVYNEGLYELADANLLASDTDNSNGISYNEYLMQEITSYNDIFEDEKIEYDESTHEIKGEEADMYNEYFEAFFDVLDADKSGEIEENEIAAFYKTLDLSNSEDGTADGKIEFETVYDIDAASQEFQDDYKGALDGLTTD